ncbi:MAG: hypothetical protein PHY48_11010 [Candidatus Cloacimonetes bacterium]|nr:hypothetical protein [Candidatus Cloacimonadota bacterium]
MLTSSVSFKLLVVFSIVFCLMSCSLFRTSNYSTLLISKVVAVNGSMLGYCESQNQEEHAYKSGEMDEIFKQQQALITIRDEMNKQKSFNKDVLKIIDNEIADIEMMFGEYKEGVATVPEKHYLFFASYLKQTNVNLQVFLDKK